MDNALSCPWSAQNIEKKMRVITDAITLKLEWKELPETKWPKVTMERLRYQIRPASRVSAYLSECFAQLLVLLLGQVNVEFDLLIDRFYRSSRHLTDYGVCVSHCCWSKADQDTDSCAKLPSTVFYLRLPIFTDSSRVLIGIDVHHALFLHATILSPLKSAVVFSCSFPNFSRRSENNFLIFKRPKWRPLAHSPKKG